VAVRGRAWRRWHRWIGLASALLIATVTVSGVALIFREQLRTPLPRVTAPTTSARPSLDALAAAASAAAGGAAVTDITLPSRTGEPYQVWLDDEEETRVLLDGSLVVIEAAPSRRRGLTGWLFAIHTGEALGASGSALSAITGLALLGLLGSGLVISRRPRRTRGEVDVVAKRRREELV